MSKHFPLLPIDGHKSFYGKAWVEYGADCHKLYSFGTHAATIFSNGCKPIIYVMDTATTLRHVKAFLASAGYPIAAKKELAAMYPPHEDMAANPAYTTL